MPGFMMPQQLIRPTQSTSSTGCAPGPVSSTPAVSNAVMNIAAGESAESCTEGYLHDIGSGSSLTIGDRGALGGGINGGRGRP